MCDTHAVQVLPALLGLQVCLDFLLANLLTNSLLLSLKELLLLLRRLHLELLFQLKLLIRNIRWRVHHKDIILEEEDRTGTIVAKLIPQIFVISSHEYFRLVTLSNVVEYTLVRWYDTTRVVARQLNGLSCNS